LNHLLTGTRYVSQYLFRYLSHLLLQIAAVSPRDLVEQSANFDHPA
jgi:hypothetical protein